MLPIITSRGLIGYKIIYYSNKSLMRTLYMPTDFSNNFTDSADCMIAWLKDNYIFVPKKFGKH